MRFNQIVLTAIAIMVPLVKAGLACQFFPLPPTRNITSTLSILRSVTYPTILFFFFGISSRAMLTFPSLSGCDETCTACADEGIEITSCDNCDVVRTGPNYPFSCSNVMRRRRGVFHVLHAD